MEIDTARWNRTISIHALRGEGDSVGYALADCSGISIHALRGEGDYHLNIIIP